MFRRSISVPRKIEIREQDGGGLATLVHWAPPWDILSAPVDWAWTDDGIIDIYERFEKGAFRKVLARSDLDVICETDHKFSVAQVFGRTGESGTLRLEEDDFGHRFEVDLPDTPSAADLLVKVRRKDIRGTSFVFSTKMSGIRYVEESGKMVRVVHEVEELYSVGFVVFPAYDTPRNIEERGVKKEAAPDSVAAEFLEWRGLGKKWTDLKKHQGELRKLAGLGA